jgi:hypothetical protein
MNMKKSEWAIASMLTLLVVFMVMAVTDVPHLKQPGLSEGIAVILLRLIDAFFQR